MSFQTPEERKRPGWVWAIFIFYILGALFLCMSVYLTVSGKIPATEASKANIANITVFDHILMFIIIGLNCIGATLLFLLQKRAFYFIGGAFILSIISSVFYTIIKHPTFAISNWNLGTLLGYALTITILWYIKKLEKQGTLQ